MTGVADQAGDDLLDDEFVLRHLFDTTGSVLDEGVPDVLVQSQRIGPGDVWRIEDLGVRTVVDLTFMEVSDDERAAAAAALGERGIALVNVPVRGGDDIAGACDVVLREVQAASACQQAVVVHCHGGVDRSVCVAMAVKAHRECTPFADQLFELMQVWDDIAVTDTMARPADDWVKAKGDPDPVDNPDPGMECPRCHDQIIGGMCECEECDHTVCPFCGDGRGTGTDGCTHLVMECHEVVPTDDDADEDGDVLRTVTSRLPDDVPMPYLAASPADSRLVMQAIGSWILAPENPWHRGITNPPDRAALAVVAAMMAGACVRANAFLDFDASQQRIYPGVVRAYSIDPDACAARIQVVIATLGEQLAGVGTVRWDRP